MTAWSRSAVLLFWLSSTSVGAQQWGLSLDGRALAAPDRPATRVLVLFFVASECPVSNRTFPEMQRLREMFHGEGVQFLYVYPNAGESVAGIRMHQAAYDAAGEAVQDPTGALVRLAHAVATPEIAVLVPEGPGWRSIYSGRIDDRFVRLGLERPQAREHFGEDAIAAALAGRPSKPPVGQPVGCAIMGSNR